MTGVISRMAAVRVVGDTICLLQVSWRDASTCGGPHALTAVLGRIQPVSGLQHQTRRSQFDAWGWGSPRLECVRTRTLTPWAAAGQLSGASPGGQALLVGNATFSG